MFQEHCHISDYVSQHAINKQRSEIPDGNKHVRGLHEIKKACTSNSPLRLHSFHRIFTQVQRHPLYTRPLRYRSVLSQKHSPNTALSQWRGSPLVYWHFISGNFTFQRVTEVISRLLASLWSFSSSKGPTDGGTVMIRQTLKLKLRWANAPVDRSWRQRTFILSI